MGPTEQCFITGLKSSELYVYKNTKLLNLKLMNLGRFTVVFPFRRQIFIAKIAFLQTGYTIRAVWRWKAHSWSRSLHGCCGSSATYRHIFCVELTIRSPNPVWMLFKNSVRAAKKTQHFTITKINCLTLFKEIIAVYTENHTKHINTKWKVTDC
jgi:hypothetical protein